MRSNLFGFIIGVIGLIFFRDLPTHFLALTILICTLPLIILLRKIRWLSFILFIVVGSSFAVISANDLLQKNLNKTIENKDLLVQGIIVSVPEQQTNGVQFLFDIKKIINSNYLSPGLVRLTWQKPFQKINAGDQWQLLVRIKRPHSTLNPGGFDEEQWLFAQRLRATGYVRFGQNNILLNSKWYQQPFNRLRQNLSEKIINLLNGNSMTGFITALAVGVRDHITAAQWQIMRATGTNHLMAIAGLHIGLMASFIYFLVNFFWRCSSRFLLHIAAPQIASVAALIAAIIYAALAGFSLPTQRAVIMIIVFLAAVIWRRNLQAWYALLLAMTIILLFDPLAVLSMSFWLSFFAVALIIYAIKTNNKVMPVWQHWLYIQWILAIGLIPLTILFYQEISLAGFIANMIAIPVIGFIVLPLVMSGILFIYWFPLAANGCIKLAAKILLWVWWVLQKLANITWLQWHVAFINKEILIITSLAILLFLFSKKILVRGLGIIFLLPLIFYRPSPVNFGSFKFTMLDVGQGLATVIQTQHHVLIYDTGAKYNDGFDMGDAVIIPYLHTLAINRIDYLIVSHGDNDHSGGAQAILQQMPVTKIITSVPNKFPVSITIPCQRGQHWQWDGVNFSILYPPVGQDYIDNESSCVLKITTANHESLLLSGDIEHKGEQYLLQQEPQLLSTNILVAPHHGSISSSSEAFVNATHPQYVLFPVGYLNRYNFPNQIIANRYQQIGALCYDSVHSGTIIFNINNNSPIVNLPQQYRIQHHHFWNDV